MTVYFPTVTRPRANPLTRSDDEGDRNLKKVGTLLGNPAPTFGFAPCVRVSLHATLISVLLFKLSLFTLALFVENQSFFLL